VLRLYYGTVICTVFCTYLGTVITNRNELIQDTLNNIEMRVNHIMKIFPYRPSVLTNMKKIKIYKSLIRPVTTYGAKC
jgi:hypothetical protein